MKLYRRLGRITFLVQKEMCSDNENIEPNWLLQKFVKEKGRKGDDLVESVMVLWFLVTTSDFFRNGRYFEKL